MSAETARILRKAKQRLTGRWCRNAIAKNADGQVIFHFARRKKGESPNTCLVCADGAVRWAVTGDPLRTSDGSRSWSLQMEHERLYRDARMALTKALPKTSIKVESFNDWSHRREADVHALFDRAIAAEEASP